jgi:hypothetical protein
MRLSEPEKDGSVKINREEAYRALRKPILEMLDGSKSPGEVVGFVQQQVKDFSLERFGKRPTPQAFGNARGDTINAFRR